MVHGSFCNHALPYIILCLSGIGWLSCNNTSDSKYFRGDVVLFEDSLQLESLTGEQVILDGVYAGRMDVCDSLVFMQHFIYPDYFIAVFNHHTGKHLGDFMPKGNGPDEHIDLSWIYQFFYEDGHLKGLLCSFYRKKIIIWNITESLNTGTTCVSRFDIPKSESNNVLGGYMFFMNNEYLVANVRNTDSLNIIPGQTYRKIDYATQETKQTYSFYNRPIDNDDEVFKALYHHTPVAHNIKGTKLSSTMSILNQINILDIETGRVKGFRMNHTPDFGDIIDRRHEMKLHYSAITADTRYIYALYVGKETDIKEGFPDGQFIHVFDWDGNFKRKLYLDKEASHIGIDVNSNVLLIKNDYTDEIYKYNLNVEK
jgi:hypothetical protein